jgi:hypothetical protein
MPDLTTSKVYSKASPDIYQVQGYYLTAMIRINGETNW